MYQCDLSFFAVNNCERNLDLSWKLFSNLDNIESFIREKYGVCKESYYYLCNGKKIDLSQHKFNNNEVILHVIPRTFGGKGGFGSMLRAIGAQIEKTTNREACRDLSGRRLRDINEEQRLKNWIAQQADRERESAERKKKKLERLCQEPKHNFKDEDYDESRTAITEKMSTSIEKGLKASTSGIVSKKHKLKDECSNKIPLKKKKLWIDAEESDTSSTDNEESEDKVMSCEKDELVLVKGVCQDVNPS